MADDPNERRAAGAVSRALVGVVRGAGLAAGALVLANSIAAARGVGVDVNRLWIDTRPLPPLGVAVVAALLVVGAVAGRSETCRRVGLLAALALVAAGARRAASFVGLEGQAPGGAWRVPPGSEAAALGLAVAFALSRRGSASRGSLLLGAALSLALAPLILMTTIGPADRGEEADLVVVLGARVYADGSPSLALADRTRTGGHLLLVGRAPRILVSGGPGDGDVHEVQAMRSLLEDLGVSPAVILEDRLGRNTQATVDGATAAASVEGLERLLVVSHAYHLPRIALAFLRAGLEVQTVPAVESRPLARMPWFVAREIPAFWAYWARSWLGGPQG